jgi:gamma-glutamyltranspeptidase/glutathione hydrolase
MLGVVDGFNSGIGGGCFILVREPTGRLIAVDGRETAPLGASRDMYLAGGTPRPDLAQHGPLAVAIPGALAGYHEIHARLGRVSFADHLRAAADVAQQGFTLDENYAARVAEAAGHLRRFAASRAVFLDQQGHPYGAGAVLRQPDLAATYRNIAAEGLEWFYRGPFAEQACRFMAHHGGILTPDDFAHYRPAERRPITSTYRGLTVIGFPPPSSGGVHVAQILNILENFDLRALHDRDPATMWHVVAEAMKLALADRAHWLGDPDFVSVPRGLIDKSYAAELARRIDLARALDGVDHGMPPEAESQFFSGHTTHIAAADAEGYWVAITTTVNTTFGSKVVVPGTGVVLNNQMDDFSIAPGVANAFGLVGNEANAIQPGKRPLSSMSPTIVLQDGRPLMTLGASGGPRIISQVVLAIVRHADLGMPLDEAIAAPRLHHQWRPNRLFVEPEWPNRLRRELRLRGHDVVTCHHAGFTQGIIAEPETGWFIGVHDPRVRGQAAGTASEAPRDAGVR